MENERIMSDPDVLNSVIIIDGVKITFRKIIPVNVVNKIPIVFLHDSLGCIDVWKDFPGAVAIATQLTCVVYDRQGYGKSSSFSKKKRDKMYLEEQADFLIKFLDALGVEKCILFGHSDGGSISLIAGAKYRSRVVAIITEGAHVFVDDITLDGIRKTKEVYRTTDLKEKLVKYHGDKVEALFNAWTETWLDPNYRDWNIEHFLHAISCPVLTLYGGEDEFGGPEQADSMAGKVGGYSEKWIIPGVGHTPHKENREVTMNVAKEFIKQVIKNPII